MVNVAKKYAVPKTKDVLGHIFRSGPKATAHVNPSTLASQGRYTTLFENVANNTGKLDHSVLTKYQFQNVDKGFEGFSQVFRKGKKVWVKALDGKIFNAGVILP